jgi:hypothetical protein
MGVCLQDPSRKGKMKVVGLWEGIRTEMDEGRGNGGRIVEGYGSKEEGD